MPSFVCKRAVINPDRTPAHIAAGRESQGWPAMATTAPTAAPSVKHPSVERSQTPSMV